MNKAILFASAACIPLVAPLHAKIGYYDLAALNPKETAVNTAKRLTRSVAHLARNVARRTTRTVVTCVGGYVGLAMGFLSLHPPLRTDYNPMLPVFIAMSTGILTSAYDKLEQKIMRKKDTEYSNTKCYVTSMLAGFGLGSSYGAKGRLFGL